MGKSVNAAGWTILTPSGSFQKGFNTGAPSTSTTMIIFVSNSTGKDSGDGGFNSAIQGSDTQPYRTIASGLARLRNNSPDWILLKKGDTWTNEQFGTVSLSGLNANELMVFSSYDSSLANNPPVPNPGSGGAQPHIKTAIGQHGIAGFSYTAVMGLYFHDYTRDTTIGGWAGESTDATGIDLNANGSLSSLVEDNTVQYYSDGMHYKGAQNLHLRRNRILNSWGTGISTGMKADTNSPDFLLYQNIWDQNGWDPVGNAGQSLNHQMYFNANYIPSDPIPPNSFLSDLTLQENISSNDPYGSQIRAGGLLDNNLWIGGQHWIGGALPHSINATNPAIPTNICKNSVYFQQENGIFIGQGSVPDSDGNVPQGDVLVDNCIFTQPEQVHSGVFGGMFNYASLGAFGATYHNTIHWKSFAFELQGGTFNTPTKTGYYISDFAGANNLGSPEPFLVQPDRTIGTYLDLILGGSGHTTQNYIDLCRAQCKDNWNSLLTAGSVNDYIRQGFGVAMIGSAYAGFTPGVPVLMPQICM